MVILTEHRRGTFIESATHSVVGEFTISDSSTESRFDWRREPMRILSYATRLSERGDTRQLCRHHIAVYRLHPHEYHNSSPTLRQAELSTTKFSQTHFQDLTHGVRHTLKVMLLQTLRRINPGIITAKTSKMHETP